MFFVNKIEVTIVILIYHKYTKHFIRKYFKNQFNLTNNNLLNITSSNTFIFKLKKGYSWDENTWYSE